MGNEKGQSLAEVIVAATVGILVVSALTFATIFSLRNANYAKTAAQATKLAQEGIERVRTGRDRNQIISGLTGSSVVSWNGNGGSAACLARSDVQSDSIWCYPITGGCDNPLPSGDDGKCYFVVDANGALDNRGYDLTSFPTRPEDIPSSNQVFQRVVLLSDDSTSYSTQKKVTVIVRWTDFAGIRESKLVTILRKL